MSTDEKKLLIKKILKHKTVNENKKKCFLLKFQGTMLDQCFVEYLHFLTNQITTESKIKMNLVITRLGALNQQKWRCICELHSHYNLEFRLNQVLFVNKIHIHSQKVIADLCLK